MDKNGKLIILLFIFSLAFMALVFALMLAMIAVNILASGLALVGIMASLMGISFVASVFVGDNTINDM